MISEEIKKLIGLTENFIAIADPDQEFTRNMGNLTGMLKGAGVTQVQAVLPANLADNGSAIASIIANKVANNANR